MLAAVASLCSTVASGSGARVHARPVELALYFNALSSWSPHWSVFGIMEISGAEPGRRRQPRASAVRSKYGWKFVGKTPLVRGLVLGIFGAFAGGWHRGRHGKTFATSLGAGDAAFALLFGAVFVGLASASGSAR